MASAAIRLPGRTHTPIKRGFLSHSAAHPHTCVTNPRSMQREASASLRGRNEQMATPPSLRPQCCVPSDVTLLAPPRGAALRRRVASSGRRPKAPVHSPIRANVHPVHLAGLLVLAAPGKLTHGPAGCKPRLLARCCASRRMRGRALANWPARGELSGGQWRRPRCGLKGGRARRHKGRRRFVRARPLLQSQRLVQLRHHPRRPAQALNQRCQSRRSSPRRRRAGRRRSLGHRPVAHAACR